MTRNILYPAFILLLAAACHKDGIVPELPKTEPVIPDTPRVAFVFVNRIGFRNDSTRHGVIDTVFQGPCIDTKFYDKPVNITYLVSTCYNRNYPIKKFETSDSIIFGYFNSSKGCEYTYQIEMIWKQAITLKTTKILRYTNINFNAGDTIKVAKDTVIKFIWPLDTASGNYQLTYQWP